MRIHVKGQSLASTSVARGCFTISGAISDRGRAVDRAASGLTIVRTLVGTKGTIWITIGGQAVGFRQNHWTITKGTKAYAGLRGQGAERGLFLASRIDVVMTGTVSR